MAFLRQKQADRNCCGSQSCKLFFERVLALGFIRDEVKKVEKCFWVLAHNGKNKDDLVQNNFYRKDTEPLFSQ